MTQVARPTIFKVVETETSRDLNFSELSIPRLFETIQMNGCRDRDSSRPQKLVVVETETCRDWSKVVETETFSRVSLISVTGRQCNSSFCVLKHLVMQVAQT